MPTYMTVQGDFCLDLLWFHPAKLVRVFFVDELDGDNGFRSIFGTGFTDTVAVLGLEKKKRRSTSSKKRVTVG